MARADFTDDEWAVIEPLPPLGERGPHPDLRRLVNGVMWRFRTAVRGGTCPSNTGLVHRLRAVPPVGRYGGLPGADGSGDR
ncbi:hypothetical protein C3488_20770 [Streptomyces sp. Ru72]|nr:hypothetical protein C3488_20770 [Streptomyces sp. Ru72]